MHIETREEWIEKIAEGIMSEIDEYSETQLMHNINFRMENGEPHFDEEAFIKFLGGFGGNLFHMLAGLRTKTGFSSTVRHMSVDDRESLARHICAHVGTKLLCRICDRF
jgi:hypothetical protein